MSLNNQDGSVGSSVSFSIIIHAAIVGLLIFSSEIKKLPIIESLINSRTSTDMSIEAATNSTNDITVAFVKPEKNAIKSSNKTKKIKIKDKEADTNSNDLIPNVPEDKKAKSKVKKAFAKLDKKEPQTKDDLKPKEFKNEKIEPGQSKETPKIVKNPNPPAEVDHTKALATKSQQTNGNNSVGNGTRDARKLVQVRGNPKPTYPRSARISKAEGTVVLKYLVTDSGFVEDIRVQKSSGSQELDNEAIDKIERWRFEPGQAGETTHPVTFKLDGPNKQLPSRLRTFSEG